jgi:anti-sigma factor RsiW
MTHEAWTGKIDAYLDGELAAGEMQELDRHLRECPACAAESLRRVQWKRAIHSAGQRYVADPAFRARVLKGVSRERSGRTSWRWWPAFALAAAAVVLAVGAITVQQNARRARNDLMVSELADLHVATLASATPVDVVSTDRHTVKPWFEGKIPFSFNLPELQGSGFELVGGRVSYLEQSPGAELIFRIRKHQISAFIFQERAVTAGFPGQEMMDARSFHLETFTRDGLRYFVIGDASPDDLRALGELLKNAK